MIQDQDFSGKVALVTGGASGIGRATASALAQAGARLVLVDRDIDALQVVCDSLGATPLALDLLDRAQCEEVVPRTLAIADQIDIFHANAGSYIGGDLLDNDPAAIDRVLELNVNAVIKNVRAVLSHMKTRRTGDVIVTSSLAAHYPTPWEPVYAPSKWAIDGFVQIVRRQMFPHGVRVGSVSPGPVVSGLLNDWSAERLQEARQQGSLIESEDVARAIVFMLSCPRHVTIRDLTIMPTNFDL